MIKKYIAAERIEAGEPDRPAIELSDEMIDAAMGRLQAFDRAWEHIDRDMMKEILLAAFSRAPLSVSFGVPITAKEAVGK